MSGTGKQNPKPFWSEGEWNPRPLREYRSPEPYPSNVLPPIICEAVLEVEDATQAPIAMIAASALSAVSASVQSLASVRRDEGLEGPSSLFFLTIAKSGERKTTCDNFFNIAIRQWESEQANAAKPELAKYSAEKKAWESVEMGFQDGLRKLAREGRSPDTANNPLIQHELRKPREPRIPQILRIDDTPEALAVALNRWPVAAIMSAEAGIVFGAHGMNPESVTRNLGQMNIFWDGGRMKRSRTTTQSVDIEGMRVTVGLQVQAEVLENFMTKSGALARGIGFLARFLFAHPESTQGTRYYKPMTPGLPALSAFNSRIRHLLDVPVRLDQDGRLQTMFLPLDSKAKDAWISFHDEIEEQLGIGCELYDVQDVASKAAENAARLACCFEVFSDTNARSIAISQRNMNAGAALMRWYLDEALRFFNQTAIPAALLNAELLEKWLAEQFIEKRHASIPAGTILQLAPNRLPDKHVRDSALELLAAHDRIRVATAGQRKDIFMHPAVIEEWRR